MQNKYVGDVGDFGKYGLLRHLAAGLRLGVVWYLVPDEQDNNDGRHLRYLNLARAACALYALAPCAPVAENRNLRRFRSCDPVLYDCLRDLVTRGRRAVDEIAAAGILPAGTVFVDEHVAEPAGRERWLARALHATSACNLVFIDPDNGLATPGRGQGSPRAMKYAFAEEVQSFARRGQSVVVYQHFDHRPDTVGRYRQALAQALRLEPVEVQALHYRRGTARAFFVIAAAQHRDALRTRVGGFLRGPWHAHFRQA